ncbi:double-strand break repair helicase AddA [Cereibacter azotoformans]|uniref:DNA 3'-5' helicase n=1 Tax=Cereibacter azotoformans TaxID=43057 RepID=A0A2T5K2U6_9RHOB|nr:double-strand break repair helicase AddA [Cereibacter azotoformans]AXQ94668.1 double-strand break repair helicase AddA [Cereibacter sphaeroides]MBO4170482.1 double-strand break repair helicase AddA [Cereibacter azotoformans]PTR16751.1 DNA helicase/exodeoxyribonuclease V subunit A [Cereibacter azotoformans]UIJ30229.1 double-strand break repair helicase AddA [Cereibacter azotoformans]
MSRRRDEASERQVQAADPRASTWLSANAGSGKTRVLTDRVARLLLDGVEPQRILCLTYTKAAASEMQNRLFRRLGEWAMLEDAALRAALDALGVEAVGHEVLAQARRLFARAIETPGGLRIQTIHSFCATLLRRFPLEAGVSPQFTELDDRAARLLRDEILEEMADRTAPALVAELARAYTGEEFGALAEEVARNRAGLVPPLDAAACRALYGVTGGADELLAQVFLGGEEEWMPGLIAALEAGSANDQKAAAKLRLLSFSAPTTATLAGLEGVLLTGASAKEPYTAKIGSFPTKATRGALGPLADRLEALMRRVEAARPVRCCLLAAERARLIHAFAGVFLPLYEARKAARGWLDFDDLIQRAKGLLTDPSVAQWVLFRLDGGIDHILVDEAQDTSPDQWKVIELLAQEFTAGRGAREVERTIFVVGDKKQSIYSFQGADVAAFDRMRAEFGERLAGAERRLEELDLLHSFRSSPAILRLVDLTFDERRRQDLGGEVRHIAFRSDMPGRAELWPLVEAATEPEPENWFDPVDLVSDEHHAARLARQVAARIRAMIEEGVQIPQPGGFRPVAAGDFLILVQRRSDIFGEIIRACKEARLPIAGADRLKLGAELAVRDLSALLAFLATPEDDLSLAAVLRSPLFGWSEAELFDLAHGREGYLWRRLREREATHPETVAILRDLRDQADFLRPFDLIERALTRHDGRRRLLARLGEEAEDGIDELLSQALAYERTDVPSLTGFLTWLQTDEVEVKRQMEAAGGRIRVMTVHGSKGLEAPIVILPDTADRKPREHDEIFTLDCGARVWKTPAPESPPQIAAAREARRARDAAENLRLLYVAMTRAQCWLIAAAAGKLESGGAWHDLIRQGMEAAGAERRADGTLLLVEGDWPAPAPRPAVAEAGRPALPAWARTHAAAPVAAPGLLLPSDLGGAKALPGEALPTELALARGSAVHRLLEHLPLHPPETWDEVARGLLPDLGDLGDVLEEVRAILSAEDLGAALVPHALIEVQVTAEVAGRRLFGTIDRLVVDPDRVLAVDYKTNMVVPARPEEVPEGILRQMGAYAEALARIYPDREVETAILWTRTASLMRLPRDIVRSALARATTT